MRRPYIKYPRRGSTWLDPSSLVRVMVDLFVIVAASVVAFATMAVFVWR